MMNICEEQKVSRFCGIFVFIFMGQDEGEEEGEEEEEEEEEDEITRREGILLFMACDQSYIEITTSILFPKYTSNFICLSICNHPPIYLSASIHQLILSIHSLSIFIHLSIYLSITQYFYLFAIISREKEGRERTYREERERVIGERGGGIG